MEEIERRLGFTPRRQWLVKGLRAAVEAFWFAGIVGIYIDGGFCTEKPDPMPRPAHLSAQAMRPPLGMTI
jgi:hypothetical protein